MGGGGRGRILVGRVGVVSAAEETISVRVYVLGNRCAEECAVDGPGSDAERTEIRLSVLHS